MDERGLRDIERWRDKIEVRLDNRQVFFLFFGSALVACMLFVLGVIVGKRLESRGRAVSPEIEDPLALLDKVATSPRPAQSGVSFPQALFGTNAKVTSGEKPTKKTTAPATAENAITQSAATTKAPSESKLATEDKKEDKKEEKKPADAKAESKAAAPATAERKEEKKPADAKAESKSAAAAMAEKKEEKKPEPAQAKAKPEAKEARPAPIPTIAAAGEGKTKGRFALQLSSFQDKAEAEAFAQKFSSERPYMVMSDIPGKGIWYRVRVGDYASAKDAIVAKEAFEKKHNVIAYVAQK